MENQHSQHVGYEPPPPGFQCHYWLGQASAF
jgi:hypothetical protein